MNTRKRHRKNYEYETSKPTSVQNLDECATELAQTAHCFAIVDEEDPYDQDDSTCTWKADLVEELDTLTQTSKRKFQKFADEIKQRAKAVVAAEAKLGKKRRKVEDDIKQMQQRLKDEKKSMENVYKFQCGQVKLNVGGHKFTTSLTTLRSQPDSMLAVMFSGRHQLATDEDGAYFIDRDGTHYRHILNYLRDDTNLEVTLPQTKREQTELLKEAQYCQLNKLETRIWKMTLPRVTQEQLNMYFINNHGNMYNHQYQYNYFSTASNYDRYRNQTVRQISTTMSLDEHDLSGLNFSKTHFSCAGISFKRSCLQQANFSGCCFQADCPVDFSDADLSEANFQNCEGLTTRGVNFKGAVLNNAKFDDGVKKKLLANLKLQSKEK